VLRLDRRSELAFFLLFIRVFFCFTPWLEAVNLLQRPRARNEIYDIDRSLLSVNSLSLSRLTYVHMYIHTYIHTYIHEPRMYANKQPSSFDKYLPTGKYIYIYS
jgi:hypothetical protein